MPGLEMQTLRAGFDRAVVTLGSVLDVEQEPVADRLALLGAQLDDRGRRRWRRRWRRPVPSGVYLHGPVGRGKTWLVDVLLDQLPAEGVLRLHAYEAARSLHREFARQSGAPGATDRAVDTLLDGVRLLFLDELHAHDPGDAMLLSRLVRALAARGAVLVATSNYPLPTSVPRSRSSGGTSSSGQEQVWPGFSAGAFAPRTTLLTRSKRRPRRPRRPR